MLTLFNQERVTELYKMELREEGYAEGIGIGRAEGYNNAYISMARDNLLSNAKKMGISVAELEKKLQVLG